MLDEDGVFLISMLVVFPLAAMMSRLQDILASPTKMHGLGKIVVLAGSGDHLKQDKHQFGMLGAIQDQS